MSISPLLLGEGKEVFPLNSGPAREEPIESRMENGVVYCRELASLTPG